jgi:hypothetical protein
MRNIKDADLTKSVALAAAGASSSTASIDLGSVGPAVLEVVELQVDLPILPALVDDKTVIITIEDSADNSAFAAIAGLGTLTATGTETPGSAEALSRSYRLPSITRRYVRATAAVLAAGGDNTGVDFEISLRT